MSNKTHLIKEDDGYEYERTGLESLEYQSTPRGFTRYEFEDRYGQKCSLQESSLATESAIWFGVYNTGPHLEGPGGQRNEKIMARMHLTHMQVAQLLPLLQHFLDVDRLPEPEEKEE